MSRVQRFDIGSLRPRKVMGDGRMRCDAHITRSGVLVYRLPSGDIQREWRPDEEVFSPKSLETLKGVVVTDDHPGDGLVTPRNARRLQRGVIGENIRRDGSHVAATIYVTDEELIRKMEAGKRQVSAGYTCDIERKSGTTPDGERYDAIQRNIVYNHSAIVEFGRAGSTSVRMDAAHQVIDLDQENRHMGNKKDDLRGRSPSSPILGAASKIKALEEGMAEAVARADAAEGRVEALEAEVKQLRKPDPNADKLKSLEVQLEKQVRRADVAERALTTLNERVKRGVESRVKLENATREVLGPFDQNGRPLRLDDLTDREIMSIVVEKLHGTPVEDERSDDYARARFDAAIEGFRAGSEALDRIREEAEKPENQQRNDATSRRQQHAQVNQDAWKKPLPSASMKRGA